MAKEWRRASAQKRGGRETPLPLETVDAERRYAGEPVLTADEVFDRRWAMTLLEQTLEQLSADFQASGRAEEYEVLQEWLTAARGEIPYEQLAVRLGTTAGAARVAVHRLRQRFREYFREHVSHTVADPSATEEEMRHVAAILGSHA
jgi:RNA polymerase sigma-70 factor (ECF subfamily)